MWARCDEELSLDVSEFEVEWRAVEGLWKYSGAPRPMWGSLGWVVAKLCDSRYRDVGQGRGQCSAHRHEASMSTSLWGAV